MAEEKRYNLHEDYAQETPAARYRRLTVGPDAGLRALVINELVQGLFGGVPGAAGLWLRNKLYCRCYPGISARAYIGQHVTLRCPAWIELAEGVVIDDFAQLVATSRTMPAIRLGAGSFLRSHAMLNAGPPEGFIHIGAGSSVGQGTIIYGNGGVSIGDNVMIAGQCFIVASSHNTGDDARPMSLQGYSARGITIADNVWLGAGAKILDGIRIGEGAIVGANAVVTRDVEPGQRVVGIPAKPLPGGRPD